MKALQTANWYGCLLHALSSVVLGRNPDGKAECDFVYEICEVVHQVQDTVIHGTQQVAEDVAERVDGPANCDDETHDAESGLDMLVHVSAIGSHCTSLAHDHLKQDGEPS